MKNLYNNEKVIFASGDANLSLINSYGDILKQFIDEIIKEKNKIPKTNGNKIKLVDIGCGAGAMTKAIKKIFPAFKVYGCDISNTAIKIAKKDPFGVEFSVNDAISTSFKNEEFDIVLIQSVLDHSSSPHKMLREVNRILRKGGRLIISGPLENEPITIHGFLSHFKFFRNHRKERCGHNFAFSKKSFLKLIKKNGFNIELVNTTWFIFAQIIDIIYYPILEYFGNKPEETINKYISDNINFTSKLLKYLRSIITLITKFESALIKPFNIGFYVFVSAEKK